MADEKKINALQEIEDAENRLNRELNSTSKSSARTAKVVVGVFVVLIICVLGGVGGYYLYQKKVASDVEAEQKGASEQQTAIAEVGNISNNKRKVGADESEPQIPPAPAAPPVEPQPQDETASTAAYAPAATEAEHQPTPQELARARKLKSSFKPSARTSDDSDETVAATASVGGEGTESPDGAGIMGGKEKGEFESKFDPVELQATNARIMKNRDFMLTQGEFIPCALGAKIDTSVEGMISCYTTVDVWGASGKIKLMERHTKVTGMIKSQMQIGSKRIFALWNRVETPNGVIVNIGSPATDSLGAAGVDGYVDTHWGERFGNALLISFVEDAVSAAFDQASTNSQVTLSTTESTTNSLASEALKQSISIPPTLTKNQGETIGIFVARDLDFSGVYKLNAD